MCATIAAIATGQAPGGIGVIRISGPQALEIAQRVFRSRSGRTLGEIPGYQALLGQVFERDGRALDDCVALVFRAPKSYTGEDVVELSCHGGLYVTRRVLEEVLAAGAVPAGRGEFTKRAYLNGKLDLAQAESVMEMISASGRQAARMAQAAGSGRLSHKLGAICDRLEEAAAHLAAWADFPEEDVEMLSLDELSQTLQNSAAELRTLLAHFDQGRVYREGLRTVIVGRPNVGKSTFMNWLAGRERSIVTPYAGTTRDVVEEPVVLAGIPLLLADTAGLRETADPVEEIGVAAARRRLASAELVLAVFDQSQALTKEDFQLLEQLGEVPAIGVVNKSDLENRLDRQALKEHFSYLVECSAASGQGLEALENALGSLLGTDGFDPDEGELFTQRQRAAASRAGEALGQAFEALEGGMTLDAVTVCLEGALAALYELTGQRVSDEVVDQVFERFCVGK